MSSRTTTAIFRAGDRFVDPTDQGYTLVLRECSMVSGRIVWSYADEAGRFGAFCQQATEDDISEWSPATTEPPQPAEPPAPLGSPRRRHRLSKPMQTMMLLTSALGVSR